MLVDIVLLCSVLSLMYLRLFKPPWLRLGSMRDVLQQNICVFLGGGAHRRKRLRGEEKEEEVVKSNQKVTSVLIFAPA